MTTASIVRRSAAAALLGLIGGCNGILILGGTPLTAPEDDARMVARFKATIQAELRDPRPLNWGSGDQNIKMYPMGPGGVAVCGRPTSEPARQRAYQINYFRGWFESIDEIEVQTPATPPTDHPDTFCDRSPAALP